MAKTLPAAFGEIGADEHARGGGAGLFDGDPRGWRELTRNQSWLCANRIKRHAARWWPAGAFSASNRSLRETGAGFIDRLEFRVTPRRSVARLRVWCNAATDGGAGAGRIR